MIWMLYLQETELISNVQEAGQYPRPVRTSAENLAPMLGLCRMHEECKILYCFQRLKGRKQLEETGVGRMIVIK